MEKFFGVLWDISPLFNGNYKIYCEFRDSDELVVYDYDNTNIKIRSQYYVSDSDSKVPDTKKKKLTMVLPDRTLVIDFLDEIYPDENPKNQLMIFLPDGQNAPYLKVKGDKIL